jgi:uncharacterized protein (DUF2267 family)
MQYDEFIQRVQIEGGIDSSEEALRATEVVLATLGEYLYRTEQSQLAAQLPRGIREFLGARESPEHMRGDVQRSSLEEFYNRVSARADTRYPHGVKLARAVTEVLMDAVSAGEIEEIKQELPKEFGVLFDRGI